MSTPNVATPNRGGMGAPMEEMRIPTMQYICGECHVEQEIKPKVE